MAEKLLTVINESLDQVFYGINKLKNSIKKEVLELENKAGREVRV